MVTGGLLSELILFLHILKLIHLVGDPGILLCMKVLLNFGEVNFLAQIVDFVRCWVDTVGVAKPSRKSLSCGKGFCDVPLEDLFEMSGGIFDGACGRGCEETRACGRA